MKEIKKRIISQVKHYGFFFYMMWIVTILILYVVHLICKNDFLPILAKIATMPIPKKYVSVSISKLIVCATALLNS